MFVDLLQPTNTRDYVDHKLYMYSIKYCAVCIFMSAFAGICKQKHSTENLSNYFPTSCSCAKFLFL